MANTTPGPNGKPGEEEPSTKDPLDEKAAMAKAILERAVVVNDPYRNVPKEADDRVEQARTILTGAMNKAKEMADRSAAASKSIPGDMLSRLPKGHQQMLRSMWWDPYSNDWQHYFLGSLKSFSSKSGYGFLECHQSYELWHCDVFIHKREVPVPWSLGQPVEFSVYMNERGQPQATDCNWLPKLPQPRAYPKSFPQAPFHQGISGGFPPSSSFPSQVGIFSPNDPSRRMTAPPSVEPQSGKQMMPGTLQEPPQTTGGTGETPAPDETNDEEDQSTHVQRNPSEGPFYIGSLKSFSAAQGYGFIQCEEVHKEYSRDTYFDRSQLPRVYNTTMLVEFQIRLNQRGHPQARNINWTPFPFTPEPARPALQEIPKAERYVEKPSPAALEKAKKLLKLLNNSEYEQAIVASIDYQGAENKEKPEPRDTHERCVDFVTFVLDRVEAVDQEKVQLQDFVKMLLLLMLAKMLRQKFDLPRVRQFTKWLEGYAKDINPKGELQVVQHFNDVTSQIEQVLTSALQENPHTQDASVTAAIQNVIAQLKDKAQS